ncbi:MAG: hypothetical protein ACLFNK_02720 [Candidatus Woesearchaeota archaeon]
MNISYRRSGITISKETRKGYEIGLDPSRPKDDNINITTHGHTDHTPRKDVKGELICSPTTRRMIEFYRPNSKVKDVEKYTDENVDVKLYDAGHCLGSKMALIRDKDNGLRTLYTGDYNTIKKYCGKAKPKRCNNLIIDSTYGDKRYDFPDYRKSIKEMTDKIKENVSLGHKTRILSYGFGKSQELCHILDKNNIRFSVDEKIDRINRQIDVKYKNAEENAAVKIARNKIPGTKERIIRATGHAATSSYRFLTDADSYYVISDHADFKQGLRFIRGCRPDNVYTVFGVNTRFAKEIKKETGIRSVPLRKGQRLIENF